MEQAFGADFGGVRVHTDSDSDALSQSLQARAFTTGKDIFFSSGEYDPSSSAGQHLLAHELTHTIQQGASNRIARAETRMVVKKTFLRKPDKYRVSPTKRRLKPALTPSDAVEMLDQKSPSAENPQWQMVRDPKTGNLGFVRLSKVADIKAPSRPGIVEVKGVADIIKALVGLFGGASTVEGLDKNRKDGLTAFGKKLWEENPDLVKRLVQVNDPTDDEETTKAGVEALEQQYPVLKDIEATTKGLMFGGLGVGMAGEALGGIGGLIGMVQGIKNFYGPEATSKDKWEAALATGKGGASIATGILGVGEKGLKIGKELVGGKTPGGIVLNTIAGFVGMISGVVKTVKGGVDTVVAFFKGAAVIVKKLKKGTETKTREVFGAINEFFSSFAGMLKGALKTAGGAVKMLQAALPTISKVAGPIMGLVGSVINLVVAGCGAIKNSISLIGWIKGLRKNNETIKKLEDKEHIRTERNMGDKLRRLMGRSSMALKLTKQGKPDPGQMEKAMSKYEKKKGRARSKRTEQDYSDVKQYRLDRDIIDNLGKRITRSLSRIPEFVLDGLADAISILGAIVSVVADIGFIATAGTGIGAAIFATTKVVSSIVTGVLSGLLRLGKVVYSVGRSVVRAIKKRLPGGKKREAAKHEKRKWDTIALMQMVSGLPELDPSDDEAKATYERTELRLGAAGVDLKKLYGKNDKPAEQAKMIYKAMAKRE